MEHTAILVSCAAHRLEFAEHMQSPSGRAARLSDTACPLAIKTKIMTCSRVQQQPDFFFEPTLSFLLRFFDNTVCVAVYPSCVVTAGSAR